MSRHIEVNATERFIIKEGLERYIRLSEFELEKMQKTCSKIPSLGESIRRDIEAAKELLAGLA